MNHLQSNPGDPNFRYKSGYLSFADFDDPARKVSLNFLIILEDNHAYQDFRKKLLAINDIGATVFRATDQQSATQACEANNIDLVFVDRSLATRLDAVTKDGGHLRFGDVPALVISGIDYNDGPKGNIRKQAFDQIDMDTINPTMLEAIIRNLLHTHLIERKLRSTILTLNEVNFIKQKFLTELNRELRTPLNSILGYTNTIENRPFNREDNDRYSSALTSIHQAGVALLQTVDKINDNHSGNLKSPCPEQRSVSLTELLEHTISDLESCNQCNNFHIATSFNKVGIKIRCYPELLQQAVVIVISNAVKYSKPGTKISVKTLLTSDHIIITVQDQGIGMTIADVTSALIKLHNIQQSPEISDDSSETGLTIAQKILASHSGKLQIKSTPGCGTIVRMLLPRH